jgi:hypothetical protein
MRPKNTEEFHKLTEPIWFSEKCDHWFRFCDYSAGGDSSWSNDKPWIFVTRDSLDKYFGEISATENTPSNLQHHSPYLRLMIEVSRDLAINPENQPLLKNLVNEFISRWSKSGHEKKLTERLAKVMATLVREPKSQRGGIRKAKKSDSKRG